MTRLEKCPCSLGHNLWRSGLTPGFVPKDHSWQYRGTTYGAGEWTKVGHAQSKCLNSCPVSLTPKPGVTLKPRAKSNPFSITRSGPRPTKQKNFPSTLLRILYFVKYFLYIYWYHRDLVTFLPPIWQITLTSLFFFYRHQSRLGCQQTQSMISITKQNLKANINFLMLNQSYMLEIQVSLHHGI